jgi:hypothetical protein
VAHQCERPACAEPATVAYGFDPARGVAWLEPFVAVDPRHGRLCRRHADAMVVPQGWWLDDRRATEQLFAAPPDAERPARRPWRSRRPTADVVALPLPAEPPVETADAEADAGDGASVAALPAWVPAFAVDDDLDGLLDARSPLLAKAFGRVKGSGTRTPPPASA